MPRRHVGLRLFCFPYAGAGAAIYSNWPNRFSHDIELCAVRLPGRESRRGEPAEVRLERLAWELCRGLTPWLDRPFAFYGHSFGALVAFETARQLRRDRQPAPRRVVVAARQAPHLPPLDPLFHPLGDAEFLDRVVRQYGGVPQQILDEPALVRQFLPTLRADFEAIETYQCSDELPLDVPITAVGGWQDRILEVHLQPWEVHTNDFTLHMIAGDHFFLQGNQRALLSLLEAELRPHVSVI